MFEPAIKRDNDNRREPLHQNMDSDDAFALSKLKKAPATIKRKSGDAKLRVTLLTNDQNLAPRLERSLGLLRADVMRVETVGRANKLINSGQSDITIVDVQGADGWPGAVFQHFDKRAAHDNIVILCRNPGDVRNYRERSLEAFDIFPIDAIDDHRFQCVIQAALLRAEALPSEETGDEIDPRSLRSLISSLPAFCD